MQFHYAEPSEMGEPDMGYGYYGQVPEMGYYGEPELGYYGEDPSLGAYGYYGQDPIGYYGEDPVGYFAEEPLGYYGEDPMAGYGYYAEDPTMGYYGAVPEMVGYGEDPVGYYGEDPTMGCYGEPDISGYVREASPAYNPGCPMPTNVAGYGESDLSGYTRPTDVSPSCGQFSPAPGPTSSIPETLKPLW